MPQLQLSPNSILPISQLFLGSCQVGVEKWDYSPPRFPPTLKTVYCKLLFFCANGENASQHCSAAGSKAAWLGAGLGQLPLPALPVGLRVQETAWMLCLTSKLPVSNLL